MNLGLLVMLIISLIWTQFVVIGRRCPSPGSRRGSGTGNAARKLPSRAHHPGFIGPQVGTPPITTGDNPFGGLWVVSYNLYVLLSDKEHVLN